MTSCVLDASAALSWCFVDERTKASIDLLRAVSQQGALVPNLWFLEVANSIWMAEKKQRLKTAEANALIDMLSKLPIEVEEVNSNAVWSTVMELARTHDLTIYDSTYLDLAVRNKLKLATFDKKLISAAKKCEVDLINLSDQ
jgi:predicted nucleic acid-binding protein